MPAVKEQLREIICKGLRLPQDVMDGLQDDQPLLGGELDVDSIDILQIILEIERHFGIRLVTGKFESEAWANLNSLAAAIEAKLAEARP
jgi:acyl carrier protein